MFCYLESYLRIAIQIYNIFIYRLKTIFLSVILVKMLQRIQSLYMLSILGINFLLIVWIDTDPTMSITENYFGYFRPYLNEYFFSEIVASVVFINIFMFRYQKMQLIILKIIGLVLIFGLFNFFDERSIIQSLTDLGLIYFIISFILIYLSHKAISNDKSIIDSSNRLR